MKINIMFCSLCFLVEDEKAALHQGNSGILKVICVGKYICICLDSHILLNSTRINAKYDKDGFKPVKCLLTSSFELV